MRKRVLHRRCPRFSRDVQKACEAGMRISAIWFAVRMIVLDLFPKDRDDPIGFTMERYPMYTSDAGSGWTILFAEEERPDGVTAVHLLALVRRGG